MCQTVLTRQRQGSSKQMWVLITPLPHSTTAFNQDWEDSNLITPHPSLAMFTRADRSSGAVKIIYTAMSFLQARRDSYMASTRPVRYTPVPSETLLRTLSSIRMPITQQPRQTPPSAEPHTQIVPTKPQHRCRFQTRKLQSGKPLPLQEEPQHVQAAHTTFRPEM